MSNARRLTLVGSTIAALVLFPSTVIAQQALSVDGDALWRVGLRTHAGQLVATPDDDGEDFFCDASSRAPDGTIFCIDADRLFTVDQTSIDVVGPLPAVSTGTGVAFDSAGRLFFVATNDDLLWQLDPATGAPVDTVPLTTDIVSLQALAALDERLFLLGSDSTGIALLVEIDPTTGMALSSRDVGALGVEAPIDAAFDEDGALWVSEIEGAQVLGFICGAYDRIELEPLVVEETWSGCLALNEDPLLINLAAVSRGPATDIPTLSHLGLLLTMLALGLAGGLVLHRRRASTAGERRGG
ncbi:MAG: hypothetical protein AAGN46_12090 [Acidobacteriota bacterium]